MKGSILPSGAMFVFCVLVSRLPLIDHLGYEYSAAVALVLPFVPGLFLLRSLAPGGAGSRTALLQSVAALGVALAVGLLNALFVKNCSPGEGLAWFILLPGAGMIWTGALAYFCAALRGRFAWYFAILAAVLLHPLYLGYFTPRVDSFNFVYGYFPGFTYDEDLRVAGTLVAWRGITFVCAIGFAAAGAVARSRKLRRLQGTTAARPAEPRAEATLLSPDIEPMMRSDPARFEPPPFALPDVGSPILPAVVVLSAAALVVAWFFRTDIGFETTGASLRRALGSYAETRHFRIHYDSARIPGDEIRWVAAEHEFRYSQVARFLGTDTNRIVESYIYPDADVKRRLIGAGNTDIAKPWRGEIHLDGESWRSTLRHELAHALAAEFGAPVIRASLNIGLTEGLAMAAAPGFGNRTPEEYAAAIVKFGIVKDPAALIRPAGFAFQSSTVSYVLMGAFCGHLIDRYGIEPFRAWYGGGSPEEAYGKSSDSLVAEWRASLDGVAVPAGWRAHVDFYFKRGSIFARECARAVANLNADGDRALGRKEYRAAEGFFSTALGRSWNASSFAGLVRALLGARQYDRVTGLFESEGADSARQGSIAGVRLLYGDALLARGRHAEARQVYDDLRALDLSPGMNEAVSIRSIAAADANLRDYLTPVVTGAMDDSTALDWLDGISGVADPAAISYLKGRLHLERRDYVRAAQETANYFAPFPMPVLNGALNDITAAAFFRLGDFLSAKVFFERTLEYGPDATLAARVRDRSERCDWYGREWPRLEVTTGIVP